MEDVTTSILGIGVMLNAPQELSAADNAHMKGLGLTPATIAELTRYYNAYGDHYPVKRH